jgi:hypothetical protein
MAIRVGPYTTVSTFSRGGAIPIRFSGVDPVEQLLDLWHCDEQAITKRELGGKNVVCSNWLMDVDFVQ